MAQSGGWGVGAALVVMFLAQAAWAGASVTLRAEVEVEGERVTLADVARLRGEYAESLGEVLLAEIDKVGGSATVTMLDVRRVLDREQVHWGRLICRGAQRVRIKRVEPREVEDGRADDELEVEGDFGDDGEGRPIVLAAQTNPIGVFDAATSDDPAVGGRTLRTRLHAWLKQQVDVGEHATVTIAFDDADAPVLDAPLRNERIEFERIGSQVVGRVPVTVRRYRGTELTATERIRTEVEVTQPVVLARRSLARGQVIAERDLEVQEVSLSSLRKQPLTDMESAIGQQSVGLLRPGAIVHVDDVTAPVVVRRGQSVTVRAMSGGVMLRMVGRAMDDGELGEVITLRNERTRERFQARVSGPREAVVNLDDDPRLVKEEG